MQSDSVSICKYVQQQSDSETAGSPESETLTQTKQAHL